MGKISTKLMVRRISNTMIGDSCLVYVTLGFMYAQIICITVPEPSLYCLDYQRAIEGELVAKVGNNHVIHSCLLFTPYNKTLSFIIWA